MIGKPTLKFLRTHKDAVVPSKAYETDTGYDLTIISINKQIGENIILYDTGLRLEPSEGIYTEIHARSSLMKLGYMLANNVGIIDNSYRGNILIALYKFDSTKEDIKLFTKVAQLIPRKTISVNVIEVENINETERGEGGFGSTNK